MQSVCQVALMLDLERFKVRPLSFVGRLLQNLELSLLAYLRKCVLLFLGTISEIRKMIITLIGRITSTSMQTIAQIEF